MGIQVEFNPDLALREHGTPERELDECFPLVLEYGGIYSFLKKGQRNYWLEGEIPLLKTEGNQKLSRPIASVRILETTHIMKNGEVWTKGKYRVFDLFEEEDKKIHFEGFAKVNWRKI